MKLAWLTDIHLNFLDINERNKFYNGIADTQCDAVLITGDIAEAPCLIEILNEMAGQIKRPIYFVLGNHDYYRGKIDEVREEVTTLTLTRSNKLLFWLPVAGMQKLNEDTILLGQDGWADGRLGDYANSKVVLNDSRMITDLFQAKILGKHQLLEKMQYLADADSKELERTLDKAVIKKPKKIIVLTHVPPFREVCMHEGKISNDDWLPYFSSKIMGEVLTKITNGNPEIEFLILCGHSHGKADYHWGSNMIVSAGGAEYYRPIVQKVIQI
jgi:predicted MPP superfamily phosphohydrolase